ncbi:uncharacterized protein HMPREF1541_03986 [Cyphellophora europaea CBS 101466]|uniref:Uncharacterized protein n=1 Tax=Cyphellophora europaea (strain CBS 101466) TaxID=1220924 RepID=W2S033_CYPE1|nr:uncharacterized protein HMPREF1541_03986 [Cyphellophora europaea CBS 101466]ETN42047.1 hypothetical protein HMPREF1541_03986 [Cyphellophora europaea CBS 101466]
MARLYSAATFLAAVAASPTSRGRSTGTATVDLSKDHGPAAALGSGFIYGFPDNGTSVSNQVPSHFLTDISFRTSRAGGAQIDAKGWSAGGLEGYQARFDSGLSNYRTTRHYGGDFILLPHDIWGADGGQGEESHYPGDDGNWTSMETFLTQLTSDMKANDMIEGVAVDLWNEPDIDIFWNRTWDQYLEYWHRSYALFRDLLPEVLISGPAMAHSPNLTDPNWRSWLATAEHHNAIPDIYAWHQIGDWEREPDTTIPVFHTMRQQHHLPHRPIDINEYAWPTEQNPASSAWYLAQLERHDLRGLRANWGSGPALHDFLGGLLANTSAGKYYPNGEWQLYKYYAGMRGRRASTAASEDLLFDVFATVADTDTTGDGTAAAAAAVEKRSASHITILAGARAVQAAATAYDIAISGLNPNVTAVEVRTWRFDWAGPEGEVGRPRDLGVQEYVVGDGEVRLVYDPPDNATAYAYEFFVGS